MTGFRCEHCGASVTEVGDGLVRRHVSRLVPRDAPRADRVCPNSGKPLVGHVRRTTDHWATPKALPVTHGDPCAGCNEPITTNEHGVARHVYELEVLK